MSFTSDLMETAPNLSTVSKYTEISGLLYLGAGALLIVWPGAVQTLLMDRDFVGDEGALFRVVGMAVAVIGWLYLFGGRFRRPTIRGVYSARPLDTRSFSTRVHSDCRRFSHTFLAIALLDVTLAIGTWVLRRKT